MHKNIKTKPSNHAVLEHIFIILPVSFNHCFSDGRGQQRHKAVILMELRSITTVTTLQ